MTVAISPHKLRLGNECLLEGASMTLKLFGPLCFGIVIGWIVYRTLRRTSQSGISDIAAVIGAVGGAAITTLFHQDDFQFSVYCIGLFVGFFSYLLVALKLDPVGVPGWLSQGPPQVRQ